MKIIMKSVLTILLTCIFVLSLQTATVSACETDCSESHTKVILNEDNLSESTRSVDICGCGHYTERTSVNTVSSYSWIGTCDGTGVGHVNCYFDNTDTKKRLTTYCGNCQSIISVYYYIDRRVAHVTDF